MLRYLGVLAAAATGLVNAWPQSRHLSSQTANLPVVDLGYEHHRAASINTTGPAPYYNFTNIRFGEPPVGPLRFSPPVAPKGKNSTIVDGTESMRICPQGNPAWLASEQLFLAAYLTGGNTSAFTSGPPNITSISQAIPAPGIGETEDCLFLDVFAPTAIFDAAQGQNNCSGAPVLVWIYGGGYTGGSKAGSGNPATLIARSTQNGTNEGVIFVELNYRLGLFGWLAGNRELTANVGLLDQRLALQWVKDNISKFGGDPNRVTVMGESAGAGSIMHHITSPSAYPQNFQRAIPQSPAFQPILPSQSTSTYKSVLSVASNMTRTNITHASGLRALPFSTLYAINAYVVKSSQYGSFTFGPAADDSKNAYVPDLPIRRLAAGLYHSNISIFVGHNANEGLLFTPPYVQNNTEFISAVQLLFPTMDTDSITYLTNVLYPQVYNGTQPYTNPVGRIAQVVSDFVVLCNAYQLASTPGGFGYTFTVPPGLHGEDIDYTFFNGDTSTPDEGIPVQAPVAGAIQTAVTTFAENGGTGLKKLGLMPYGNNLTITNFGLTNNTAQIRDPAARVPQCNFWTQAPYDKQSS